VVHAQFPPQLFFLLLFSLVNGHKHAKVGQKKNLDNAKK